MIDVSNQCLMMIEPTKDKEEPKYDMLTVLALIVKDDIINSGQGYRGWQTCHCGATSGNTDLRTSLGRLSNSLLVHYVKYHRSEVPASEITKLLEEAKAVGFISAVEGYKMVQGMEKKKPKPIPPQARKKVKRRKKKR